MHDLNELELASVVGGFTINHGGNHDNNNGNTNAYADLSTHVSQHGRIMDSNVSTGNTVIQNSPTLPLF